MAEPYLHNSKHKEFIRDKWVEFASLMAVEKDGLKIITFPAEEMHDLRLFAEKGLISWEETETGAFYITKGKIVCFETVAKYFRTIRTNLTNATVEQTEIGSYLRQNYNAIMGGSEKVFPVDVVNLDYDGNIARSKVPIAEVINLVFEYQAKHRRSFSLFLTWPFTEDDDPEPYKEMLKQTIANNLEDPRAVSFKDLYEAHHPTVEELDYNKLSVIGVSKVIIQKASRHQFNLHKNEFYVYGEQDRRQMFSILLNFDYQGDIAEHALYTNCVAKTLVDVIDLRDAAAEEVAP